MDIAYYKNIISFIIFGLILIPSILSVNAELLPPRQQMASGIDAADVECKSGFVLMIRSTNGAAACVTSSTSLKLSNAGWGDVIITIIEEPKEGETKVEVKQSESPEETEGNVLKIKIKDGVGSGDR